MKNVLIGCEESQVLCKAFRLAGFDAYSCDVLETRGNRDWHLKMDVIDAINLIKWDLIILHPDCTALAVSGNRWYGKGIPLNKKRVDAIAWTIDLWNVAIGECHHVALENPVGVLFKHLPNVSYIQPWQFGHGETKKTGFALHGLSSLVPTNVVAGREQRIFKMPPSKNRKRDRSVTYEGVAQAIVKQWGSVINYVNV